VRTGELVAAAIDTGAAVIVVAAGTAGPAGEDRGSGAVEAIERSGGLRGAALVVLCDVRASWTASAGALRRDPRGVSMTGAGGGLAGALWSQLGARLVPGASFVLEALDFDARMRSARAVVVGEGRLDRETMQGRVTGEIATRARQSGVPCHAIVGQRAIDRFDARILDLQTVVEAATLEQIEAAGEALAAYL
jgi:glycerate kinase